MKPINSIDIEIQKIPNIMDFQTFKENTMVLMKDRKYRFWSDFESRNNKILKEYIDDYNKLLEDVENTAPIDNVAEVSKKILQYTIEQHDLFGKSYMKAYIRSNCGSDEDEMERLYMDLIGTMNDNGKIPVAALITRFVNASITKLEIDEEVAIMYIESKLDKMVGERLISSRRNRRNTVLFIELRGIEYVDMNFPMICPPADWNNKGERGGYISNYERGYKTILHRNNELLEEASITSRGIDVINRLQRQPISVSSIIDTIRDHILELHDLNRKFKRSISEVHDKKKMRGIISRVGIDFDEIENRIITMIAFRKIIRLFQIKKIYFTFSLDFRGRAYVTGPISPTSDKTLRKHVKFDGFTSNVCEYDGTASMLQILGSITGNRCLRRITNITSNSDIDSWTELRNILLPKSDEELQKLIGIYHLKGGTMNIDIKNYHVLNSKITRDVIKSTIMKLLYGSNVFTTASSIRLGGILDIRTIHIALLYMSFETHFKLEYDLLTSLRRLNNESISRNKHGVGIAGKYNSFENTYKKLEERVTYLKRLNGGKTKISWKIVTDKIDRRKSNRALPVHLFHFIDSNVCFETIEHMHKTNCPIITIHDAFVVPENYAKQLVHGYRWFMVQNRTILREIYENSRTSSKEFERIIEKIELTFELDAIARTSNNGPALRLQENDDKT